MNIASDLQKEANQLAHRMQERSQAIHGELLAVRGRLEELQREIKDVEAGLRRTQNFTSEVDGVYKCPYCWVERNHLSSLIPLASGIGIQSFKCTGCGYESTFAP